MLETRRAIYVPGESVPPQHLLPGGVPKPLFAARGPGTRGARPIAVSCSKGAIVRSDGLTSGRSSNSWIHKAGASPPRGSRSDHGRAGSTRRVPAGVQRIGFDQTACCLWHGVCGRIPWEAPRHGLATKALDAIARSSPEDCPRGGSTERSSAAAPVGTPRSR